MDEVMGGSAVRVICRQDTCLSQHVCESWCVIPLLLALPLALFKNRYLRDAEIKGRITVDNSNGQHRIGARRHRHLITCLSRPFSGIRRAIFVSLIFRSYSG